MGWTMLLSSLVLAVSPYAIDALLCRGGFEAGLQTEFYDIECTGNNNVSWACYAAYTDNYEPGLESGHWTYGCIIVDGMVDKCGKNFNPYDVDHYYCCCTDDNCNDGNMHDDCWEQYQAQPKFFEADRVLI